jgi:serine/threonine protein kinase
MSALEQALAQAVPPLSKINITKQLGKGSFGTVYESEIEGQKRAIKIIPLNKSREDVQREYDTLERLRHTNIVRLHGMGWIEGYIPAMYLVMELGMLTLGELVIRQRDLDFFLRDGRLESCLFDLSKAISYLEDEGVLHQDIKPENVLVWISDAGTHHYKLTDFGLATIVNCRGYLAASSKFGGTPFFMSPEALRGDTKHIDHRSEVYSLGVVGFWLAMSNLPYDDIESDDPRAARAKILAELKKQAGEQLKLTPGDFNPELRNIVGTINQMLCFEKNGRQTPAELKQQLQRILNVSWAWQCSSVFIAKQAHQIDSFLADSPLVWLRSNGWPRASAEPGAT